MIGPHGLAFGTFGGSSFPGDPLMEDWSAVVSGDGTMAGNGSTSDSPILTITEAENGPVLLLRSAKHPLDHG